ncbi:SIMPL domain-containing protein [Streptomyces sp. NPDC048279]|uniref:SIMPL domain-containing protein n=1 Tax=Streptomyces sp. NPDC048279 TaxID=3154714 RepID=UPI0034199434
MTETVGRPWGIDVVDRADFDVRDKPALRDEARREAVAAARRRAGVSTEAAGVPLGTVLHITDVAAGSVYSRYQGHVGGGGGSAG